MFSILILKMYLKPAADIVYTLKNILNQIYL